MQLKETAFTKNVTTNGSSTPDWTQDIGQSKSYYMDYDGFSDICVGMLYYRVEDYGNISVPLGKGGKRQSLDQMENYSLEIASIFDNIYVNGIHLDDQKLIMFVLKEKREIHKNRRQLKFSKEAKYHDDYLNEKCIEAISEALKCGEGGSWIVTDMNINRESDSRPRLDLSAVVINEYGSKDFPSVEVRSNFIKRKKGLNGVTDILYNPTSDKARQIIYFGAPGTSKSTLVKKEIGKCPQHRITFHPDTDYSNFVGAYKPTMDEPEGVYSFSELVAALKEIKLSGVTYPCHKFAAKYWKSLKDLSVEQIKTLLSSCEFTESMNVEISKGIAIGEDLHNKKTGGEITYKFVAQTFVKAYVEAWKKLADDNEQDKRVFLIIEEINRGNCAQIFGDLFQLLDRNTEGYSDYSIEPDADLQRYLAQTFSGSVSVPESIASGKIMLLPPNLYIWATMNTSDQSLFPIDSAFKRRWDWKYMPIKNAEMGYTIALKDRQYDWWNFVDAVNKRIEKVTESEDKQIGYWFAKPDKGNAISAEKFVSKVVFYLWNDVFKDYGHEINSPFVIKQDDGKKVELRFKSFFDKDGNVDEKIIVLFFWGLKLETIAAAIQDDQTNEALVGNETQTEDFSETLDFNSDKNGTDGEMEDEEDEIPEATSIDDFFKN